MFDEDPGSVKQGEPHWVMRYMKAWRPTFIYKEFLPFLEQWGVWVPGSVGGYFRSVQEWKKFATSLIQSCRKRESKTPYLQTAMTGIDGFLDRPLTDSELAEESMGGMFGGSGTTANTFAYLLWSSLGQRDIVKRLQEELRTVEPDDGDVTLAGETCSRLHYLQAVINETLRLYPTIIATLPRMAVRDTAVAGLRIPAGVSVKGGDMSCMSLTPYEATVGTQNYTTHRNKDAFEDPESFVPDRWLQRDGDKAMKDAFVPFSVGSRSCIGINLAKMELSKLTAAFFLRFDAIIDPSMTEDDMELYDCFSASPRGGKLFVQLRKR